MALTAAEALAGAAGLEPTAQTLTRLAGAAKSMPDATPPTPSPGRVIDPNEPMPFPDANELIEEIARRFGAGRQRLPRPAHPGDPRRDDPVSPLACGRSEARLELCSTLAVLLLGVGRRS
jgi:hypothetical protein